MAKHSRTELLILCRDQLFTSSVMCVVKGQSVFLVESNKSCQSYVMV